MPDNLRRKAPEDATKINFGQPYEVAYWCEKFKCTEEQLWEAVSAVGVSVREVKQYLGID